MYPIRYDAELTAKPEHKCTQRDMSHTRVLHQKVKDLIAFIKQRRDGMSGSKTNPDDAVVDFELQVRHYRRILLSYRGRCAPCEVEYRLCSQTHKLLTG